jgi:hypothetical protein
MNVVPEKIRNMRSFAEFYEPGESVYLSITVRCRFSGVVWAVVVPLNAGKRHLVQNVLLPTVNTPFGCEKVLASK